MRDVGRRLFLALFLLTAMAALAVHYGAQADARTAYPSQATLADSYTQYHGDRVVVWPTVSTVGDGQVTGSGWTIELSPVPDGVDPGDTLAVAGTARPGRVVEADRVAVVDAANQLYLYAVSALALAGSALFVLSRWRFDREELALVPRTDSAAGGERP